MNLLLPAYRCHPDRSEGSFLPAFEPIQAAAERSLAWLGMTPVSLHGEGASMTWSSTFGRLMRRLAGGVLLPFHHARLSGQWRSAWAGAPLSADGRILAWYTRPVVELLDRRDYKGKRVLEFGGGYSTAFWCRRGADVTTLEDDAAWFGRIGELVEPYKPRLYLVDEPLREFPAELASERFDVIVVDGLDRARAAQLASTLLGPGGAIIVDNSEGSWSKSGNDEFPIMSTLGPPAFQRVDFYGYGLGVFKPSCTSVFFRERCFLFDQSDRPRTTEPVEPPPE